jgi:hypothetical protein
MTVQGDDNRLGVYCTLAGCFASPTPPLRKIRGRRVHGDTSNTAA